MIMLSVCRVFAGVFAIFVLISSVLASDFETEFNRNQRVKHDTQLNFSLRLGRKSEMKNCVSNIKYPPVRRNECVVDDYYGIKVPLDEL